MEHDGERDSGPESRQHVTDAWVAPPWHDLVNFPAFHAVVGAIEFTRPWESVVIALRARLTKLQELSAYLPTVPNDEIIYIVECLEWPGELKECASAFVIEFEADELQYALMAQRRLARFDEIASFVHHESSGSNYVMAREFLADAVYHLQGAVRCLLTVAQSVYDEWGGFSDEDRPLNYETRKQRGY